MVTTGDSVLAADQIDIDRKTGEANAAGQVVLEDLQGRMRAENATFFLEDETGFLEEGEVYMPQTRFQITGKKIEKGIGQSYHIWDGTLTTCQCEDGAPDWSITGEEIDLALGGFGTLHDGTFKIKDTPVLYLPWGIFPVQRDRQSGFLFPRFGFSNTRGFQYLQPYYWAIDKSSDATIATDVETARRLGVLAEYRYALAPNAGGDLTATYFNETHRRLDRRRRRQSGAARRPHRAREPRQPDRLPPAAGPRRQPHPSAAVPGQRHRSCAQHERPDQSAVYENIPSTTRRYTTSRAGIAKVWDWGSSRARRPTTRTRSRSSRACCSAAAVEASRRARACSIRVPAAAPQHRGGRVLPRAARVRPRFRLRARGAGPVPPRSVRVRQPAARAAPDRLLPVPQRHPGRWSAEPDRRRHPDTRQPVLRDEERDRFQSREILQVMTDMESEVSRVYDVDGELGDIKRLKHTIEPFLGYNYTPVVGQDNLPLYDFDRPPPRAQRVHRTG
jgi:hypothetical protein